MIDETNNKRKYHKMVEQKKKEDCICTTSVDGARTFISHYEEGAATCALAVAVDVALVKEDD